MGLRPLALFVLIGFGLLSASSGFLHGTLVRFCD